MTIRLHTAARQRMLLRGLKRRCAEGVSQWHRLGEQQRKQSDALALQHQTEKKQQQSHSEEQLTEYLRQWDTVDEHMTAAYEQDALSVRVELNRLNVEYRRRHREMSLQIRQQYDQEIQAANKDYDSKKHLPGKQKARDLQQLDGQWIEINHRLDVAREVASRRIQRLPDPPTEPDVQQPPESVAQALGALQHITTQCDENLIRLDDDVAVRLVSSVWPWVLMLFTYVVWCAVILAIAPQRIALWFGGGICVPIIVGMACYGFLNPRVRRVTLQWYPPIEQLAINGLATVHLGQQCATSAAAAMAKQLKVDLADRLKRASDRRDMQLQEMEKQLTQQRQQRETSLNDRLAALDRTYHDTFADIESTHNHEFMEISGAHREKLAQQRQQRSLDRESLTQQHRQADEAVAYRLREGLKRGLGRIDQACDELQQRFPDWDSVALGALGNLTTPAITPVGYLDVANYLRSAVNIPHAASNANGAQSSNNLQRHGMSIEDTLPVRLPDRLPIVMATSQHRGILIDCPEGSNEAVVELVRAVLWRLLSSMPAGKVKLTLLDPIGRGQTFSSLLALADHDPSLVGHRAWTQPNQIESRLLELTQHMEDVLQTYLRNVYETIDQYNCHAGSMAEPYRVIAAMGIPRGLTPQGYEALRAVMENGHRCGMLTVLVRDPNESWPHDFAPLATENLLHLRVDAQGNLRHTDALLGELPFEPIAAPPSALTHQLVEQIGSAAIAGRRVEIPFDDVMPAEWYNDGDSADGLDIPLGQQGAGRQLRMQLGEGVRQHMLVAGKTGSGKSTLLHTIITAGALKYSPDQLHVYLLDFKKGVEFKLYADAGLPHARVIGIESEREFGQSVLERLDGELQRRGEAFRAAGVQELRDFRRVTGNALPRILLVVDEFQELFIRDDRIAQDCTMLLDRLVRQGRSFGMHVVLSSQSLAGAYSLPRNTMGQMAVRVALQCSESDALVILAEDNSAARLLSRPGEAIYNDEGGLVEGNQPFQVGWLDHDRHRDLLADVAHRYPNAGTQFGPTVIFEGNRPARWTAEVANNALTENADSDDAVGAYGIEAMIGEAIAIGPPVALRLPHLAGRNVMMVGGDGDQTREVLGVGVCCLFGQTVNRGRRLRVVMFDGQRSNDETLSSAQFVAQAGVPVEIVKPRDAQAMLVEIAELVNQRTQLDAPEKEQPVLLVIDPLERFRDLRQDDNAFSFSLDAQPTQSGGGALQTVLRDGPAVGVHVIVACGSVETINRWLPRQSQHDLELYILGRMSVSDSSQLIDNPEAGRLSPASMLLYDDANGKMQKFRVFELPAPQSMKDWLEGLIENATV